MKKVRIFKLLLVASLTLAAIIPNEKSSEGPIIDRGLTWLAAAQLDDGSWGAGSHNYHTKEGDINHGDPATTAFSALALLRSGSTISNGPYQQQIRKALDYLVTTALESPAESPYLVAVTGTQPQVKLGNYIDVALTAQFLSRIMEDTPESGASADCKDALQICIQKLEMSQLANGSWGEAGWAGVLQSAAAFQALENGRDLGMPVRDVVWQRAKNYQLQNVQVRGGTAEVSTGDAAGISLYSIAGNQRALARDVGRAYKLIEKARKEGRMVSSTNLSKQEFEKLPVAPEELDDLWKAYENNRVMQTKLNDQQVLAGFGNYGGEEFLSYMMTSESLMVAGGEQWRRWNADMEKRLATIQNQDGSWSGHHCITSPVFCTAAALLTLTTQYDTHLLKYVEIDDR